MVKYMQGLSELSGTYNSVINAMPEAGLPVQIAQNYKETYQKRNTGAINNMIHQIETEDIPYVNRNIQALTELIQRTSAR